MFKFYNIAHKITYGTLSVELTYPLNWYRQKIFGAYQTWWHPKASKGTSYIKHHSKKFETTGRFWCSAVYRGAPDGTQRHSKALFVFGFPRCLLAFCPKCLLMPFDARFDAFRCFDVPCACVAHCKLFFTHRNLKNACLLSLYYTTTVL